MLKHICIVVTLVGVASALLCCQGIAVPNGEADSANPAAAAATSTPSTIPELTRLLDTDPNDIDTLVRLGHLLLTTNKYQEAREITSRALAINPAHPEALTHTAVLLQLQGEEDMAGAMFDRLVHENPALAEAWFQRGMLAVKSRRHDVARECFDRYVALAPTGEFADQVSYYLSLQRQRLRANTDQPSSPASKADQTAR